MTRTGKFKLGNTYQKSINPRLYQNTPKSIFAAIAASYQINHDTEFETVDDYILNEWRLLYEQGIVPQKPPKQ
jgi:hypothetical protein